MGGRRRSDQLAEELALNPSTQLGDHHVSPHVFDRLCRIADEVTTNGDRGGLRAAQRAIRLAGRLAGPVRCEMCQRPFQAERKSVPLARGFARLAAALRLRERYDHAEAALVMAFHMDPPDEIQGDLYRRRALLRVYQDRWAEALADATTGLRLSTPGHRRGRALVAMGVVSFEIESFGEAIQHLEEAIQVLDPAFEHEFIAGLICYANALTKGDDEAAQEGLRTCAEVRTRLKPQHQMQRAKLWWVEGLLLHRLGQHRKAWLALNTARLALLAMRAAPEVAAITADMACIAPLPRAVKNMCHEAGQAIPEYHPLAAKLQALGSARRPEISATAGVLRAAAARLAACPPAC